MKHEPYHTCDRCGKKIEYVPTMFEFFSRLVKVTVKPSKYKTITADISGFIDKVIGLEFPFADKEITLKIYGSTMENELDLCADCTKAFNEFMKGEK